jgi:hypothetical protein
MQNSRKKQFLQIKSTKSIVALSNKIKDVEVDHEIDNYLPAINTYLKTYRREELIKENGFC